MTDVSLALVVAWSLAGWGDGIGLTCAIEVRPRAVVVLCDDKINSWHQFTVSPDGKITYAAGRDS